MTFAVLIGAAILLSAGYILRRQRLDTLEFRAGRIRLARSGSSGESGRVGLHRQP